MSDVEADRVILVSNLDTFLKEELIEMTFDLDGKSMYAFKGTVYYDMSNNNNNK